VLDASTDKRQNYFVVWRHLNCSSANYTIPMEHKMYVLPTKLHKGDAFYKNWMRLHTENVYFSFHASVNNVFATCGISSIINCAIILWMVASGV